MVSQMTLSRGGRVGHMDDRYCIDNGAMIAYTGLLQYLNGQETKIIDSFFT